MIIYTKKLNSEPGRLLIPQLADKQDYENFLKFTYL